MNNRICYYETDWLQLVTLATMFIVCTLTFHQPDLPTLCFLNVSNGREENASDGSYYNTEEV